MKIRHGAMQAPDDDEPSRFAAYIAQQEESDDDALIWHVNAESWVPVRLQLVWLWLRRLVGFGP